MPTENSNSSKAHAAPYMSYGVFLKGIETLAETTVPTGALDRRVLGGFSGADYGSLISGLRFLGLIDDERKATTQFREVVEFWKADKTKFKERLLEILADKYLIIIGKLDLKRGTSAELEKKFKDYGVTTGPMLKRSVRFFVKAWTEAGVTLSPHITAPKPRTPSTTTRKSATAKRGVVAKQREESTGSGINEDTQPPGGFERLPLPGMPNSFIQYPTNLTEAYCQILEAMVRVLRTSVEARTGGKEKKA